MGKRIRTDQAKLEEAKHYARMVEKALRDSAPTAPMHGPPTTAGDRARMRGVPIQAVGVGGTLPGTDPLRHVMRLTYNAKASTI